MPDILKTFRAKPVTIHAVRLTDSNVKQLKELLGPHGYEDKPWDPVNIYIRNEHGVVVLEVGDWLIKGSRGEFYPCKNSTFEEKYEPAAPDQTTRR